MVAHHLGTYLDRFNGWTVSTFAGNLQAADNRDSIYGHLGVSGTPITPDYDQENKVSHVYWVYRRLAKGCAYLTHKACL
jgi:phosphoglycerol transferase MdoB-like AlkP superfamily enzyme